MVNIVVVLQAVRCWHCASEWLGVTDSAHTEVEVKYLRLLPLVNIVVFIAGCSLLHCRHCASEWLGVNTLTVLTPRWR